MHLTHYVKCSTHYGMDEDRLAANVPLTMILACKIICSESLMRCRLDGSL